MIPRFSPHPRLRLRLLAAITCTLLAPFATSTLRGTPSENTPAAWVEADPIMEALSKQLAEQQAEALLENRNAHLKLEIVEVRGKKGTQALGRFNAPLRSGRAARLERRLSLERIGGIGPVDVELDIRILPRVLSSRSVRFELESRTRDAAGEDPWWVRRTAEILREGRSILLEAYQIPGSRRRLLLALSWANVTPDPLQDLFGPHPSEMVDLVLELVREEEGTEQTLRRELLSAGLGTEATRLIRLVGGLERTDREQHLEVRLHPQEIGPEGLLLGISVRGSLEAEQEGGNARWVDHRDHAILVPGARYTVELGGGPEDPAYRLLVRSYY